uniref:EvC ciliary complex subunit 2 n=1 Tax=Kryptolebias marmoratus TaxID=37003 RepID=A0A3Q2ZAX2_KRYMA
MFRVHLIVGRLTLWLFVLNIPVSCLFSPPLCICCCQDGTAQIRAAHLQYNSTSWCTPTNTLYSGKYGSLCTNQGGKSAGLMLLWIDGTMEASRPLFSGWSPASSSAPAGPWGHSFYSSFSSVTNTLLPRKIRSTLIRQSPPHPPPQVQSVAPPSSFRVTFHKCAQVRLNTDPPLLTFFLLIHNMGPLGGTNLSQVVIRDSISGIRPLKTEGRVVEKGYQTFTVDSLFAGSQVVVNYTAHVRNLKNEVLDLPAFLTFSNASQNDVSMFGPLTANLILRVNSTDQIYLNHGVHFAGFVAGFFITLVLLLLGFLAMNLTNPRARLSLFQQKRNRCDSDPEDAECNMSETVKEKAAFEDKIVDVMVLEDPQNMYQALDNLEMSSLLNATSSLEDSRIQIYKDMMSCLLGGLRSRGQASSQAQQRLLSVLHGQLLGMEGRLKEERGARMAALAGQCNLETREEMEAEHRREAAEKAQADLLCQHADQQELLQCGVLLEKLHKLSQSQLQRLLLVRHEEASANVQRQIIRWRRVELHKIFTEELEEATRMGELEKNTARSLQHDYFSCQDQLEEVLDVVAANQRYVLAERSAQRKFLVHSLHSLNGLISDAFSNTSSNLDRWFDHIRRGSLIPAEQIDQLQEKAQKELVVVKQRLDETLNQERRAMRCGLIKKRRELISDLVRVHKQRRKDLSSMSKSLEEKIEMTQHLLCWQNLLTAHSLELAELINNLDEEAAADIRKVTMRVIQGAIADVKAIQPSAAQAVLALLPPGEKHLMLQVESESGSGNTTGQGASALLQGQERLHQEGKAALHTLSSTREALQDAMEKELQEQKELRTHWRDFFRCLCLSQLTLSEDDRLRMKLEFQKCLSVIDHCLVLPHAISRTKLCIALAAWRKEREDQMANMQSKGKTAEARKKTDTSDVVFFQKRLQERIQLFEKEKEMESGVMDKGLQEAEQQLQTERKELDSLQMSRPGVASSKIHQDGSEGEDTSGEDDVFQLQVDRRMAAILHEALHKREQVVALMAEGFQAMTANSQAKENLKDQMELKRLYSNCDQDLEFASQLVKQSHVSDDVLLETLRLLLPTLAESELLSITDALCPKNHPVSASADQEHSGCAREPSRLLPIKLRESVVQKNMLNMPSCAVEKERHREKWRSLVEKLLPRSRPPLPAEERGKKDGFTKARLVLKPAELVEQLQGDAVDTAREAARHPAEENMSSSASACGPPSSTPATGERLFVFRDPPESRDSARVPKGKRRRNFLNLKKGSVAPTT